MHDLQRIASNSTDLERRFRKMREVGGKFVFRKNPDKEILGTWTKQDLAKRNDPENSAGGVMSAVMRKISSNLGLA